MTKKLLYYILIATGVTVILVGLISFFSNYGKTSFSEIWGQITGVICVVGGVVNLMVASKFKKEIDKSHSSENKDKHNYD
jgi:tetrahydromethanopterin S-methyltransferase subunit E